MALHLAKSSVVKRLLYCCTWNKYFNF